MHTTYLIEPISTQIDILNRDKKYFLFFQLIRIVQ
jgi:hypothetical protein